MNLANKILNLLNLKKVELNRSLSPKHRHHHFNLATFLVNLAYLSFKQFFASIRHLFKSLA